MDAAELEWIAWTTPITTSLGTALAASDAAQPRIASAHPAVTHVKSAFGLEPDRLTDPPFVDS